MHPTKTTYHLATSPRDYRFCQALYKAAEPDWPPVKLGFPTVMALRDGAIIGFMATNTETGQVVAGPLITDPTIKQRAFVALRLCEAYEQVLKQAGVTMYRIGVIKDNPQWAKVVHKIGFEPYLETDDSYWYERQIA